MPGTHLFVAELSSRIEDTDVHQTARVFWLFDVVHTEEGREKATPGNVYSLAWIQDGG